MATVGIYIGDVSINGGGVTKFAINLARALKPYHRCLIISDFLREEKFHKGYEDIENIVLNEKSEIKKICKLNKVCNENNIDLIISNEIYLNRRCALISKLNKRKLPYITVTHMRPDLWFKETNNALINILKRNIIKLGFNAARYNISVSNGLSSELKSQSFCKKPMYIYNPIINQDILKYRKSELNDNTLNKEMYDICVCGWISEIKNYETVIRAVSLIKDKLNIRLNIIGGYSDKYKCYYEKLIKLIDELGIRENIKFWGTVENPYPIMKQMDALVLTSKIEALPTVLIEGMAIGLPLISSNCKYGPSEILDNGNYGYMFEVDDYEELSNQIIDLLSNNEQYLYYKNKSIQRSEMFKFENIAKQYNNIINDVLENSRK